MNTFRQIFTALSNVVGSYFDSDMDAMRPKVKEIYSNPKDREEFQKALDNLRQQEMSGSKKPKVTFKLSNDEEITLTT